MYTILFSDDKFLGKRSSDIDDDHVSGDWMGITVSVKSSNCKEFTRKKDATLYRKDMIAFAQKYVDHLNKLNIQPDSRYHEAEIKWAAKRVAMYKRSKVVKDNGVKTVTVKIRDWS